MKTLRAIVVLLVSLALPFSAMATMLENLHCHHDGLGALLDATPVAMPVHHCAHHAHHTATPSTLHQANLAKTGDHGCDCAVKCQCQHHCTSGGAIADMRASSGSPTYLRAAPSAALTLTFVSDAQLQRLLRPPIAALPSAA